MKSWVGIYRRWEGKTECSLCGDECENVSNVLWECSAHTVYVKKNTTLIKICVPLFDKKRVALLWFASEFVRGAYCGTFCQRAAFSREKCRNARFTRRRTFRNSVKVWRTQRDKRAPC